MNEPPSTRQFVTALISSIANKGQLSSSDVKDELLTLHVLFAKELLPALDLLDRGLVTRIHADGSSAARRREASLLATEQTPQTEADHRPSMVGTRPTYVYYVRSTQPPSSSTRGLASKARQVNYDSTAFYEVRLDAWSCSCPAFTFASFPASSVVRDSPSAAPDALGPMSWQVGGLTRGHDVPMCKHLLACVMVAQECVPQGSVETRVVSIEELAGWGAGWGD